MISTSFTGARSLNSTQSSLIGCVWLASLSHRECRLCLPRSGIIGWPPHLPGMDVGSRDLKSDLHTCTTNFSSRAISPTLLAVASLNSFIRCGLCQGGGWPGNTGPSSVPPQSCVFQLWWGQAMEVRGPGPHPLPSSGVTGACATARDEVLGAVM